MYIPLLTVARGHSPPHGENTQALREAITEDDDDDEPGSKTNRCDHHGLRKCL